MTTTFGGRVAVSVLTSIAVYNTIELNFVVLLSFKKHGGLYFWALLIASWGTFVDPAAFWLKYLGLVGSSLGAIMTTVTFMAIGWVLMVSGQSVVLWSRLHLVCRDNRLIRYILVLIIVDFVIFHGSTIPVLYGLNLPSPRNSKFMTPFNIIDKIEMTGFSLQEFLISGIYILEAWRILTPATGFRAESARQALRQIIYANVCLVVMNIVLLGTEYASLNTIQAPLKALVYSIKLKLEFSFLNQLLDVTSGPSHSHSGNDDHQLGTYPTSNKSNVMTGIGNSAHVRAGGVGKHEGPRTTAMATAGDGDIATHPYKFDDEANYVVATTEVTVHHETVEDGLRSDGFAARGASGRQRRSHSPTSSEVQFAEQGF